MTRVKDDCQERALAQSDEIKGYSPLGNLLKIHGINAMVSQKKSHSPVNSGEEKNKRRFHLSSVKIRSGMRRKKKKVKKGL